MSKSKIKTRQSGHDPLVARAEELCAALRALDAHLADYVGYRSHVLDMISRLPALLRPDADGVARTTWLYQAANTNETCRNLAEALATVCGDCEYCPDPHDCLTCGEADAGGREEVDPFLQFFVHGVHGE